MSDKHPDFDEWSDGALTNKLCVLLDLAKIRKRVTTRDAEAMIMVLGVLSSRVGEVLRTTTDEK